MIRYQELHWNSAAFLRKHVLLRLIDELRTARSLLIGTSTADKGTPIPVEHILDRVANLVVAWETLIRVENGEELSEQAFQLYSGNFFPVWLTTYLQTQTETRVALQGKVSIHDETFYESLLMICEVSKLVGALKYLSLSDARGIQQGLWVRAVFIPSQTPYPSLNALISSLAAGSEFDQDLSLTLQVLARFLKINNARFTLQNNTQTGEQALAAWFPAASQSAEQMINGEAQQIASIASSESPDQTPLREAGTSEEHRAGLVLAPTPHEIKAPVAEAVDQAAVHTIAGQVLAPPSNVQPPSLPDGPLPGELQPRETPAAEEERLPETLIVPPPDFRRRLLSLRPSQDVLSAPTPKALEVPPDQTGTDTKPL
ncbi:MAG TPA: hypothetical protein VHP83_24755 [Aggregatilineaceae bacterium]|nr:hypothetical protein [Aggregatilineaceae bacterium]